MLLPLTVVQSPTSPTPDNGPVDGNMVIARPSGGSVKGLLDLPAELRLCVFDFLPDQAPADLASLARTCKALWWPASKALYKCITLLSYTTIHNAHGKERKRLVSFLQLIHTLLFSNKPILKMVEELRITTTPSPLLIHFIHPSTGVFHAPSLAERASSLKDISMRIFTEIKQATGNANYHGTMFNLNYAVQLVVQRSPNLRYIAMSGYGRLNWDLLLHHCWKLKIIRMNSPRALTLQTLADLALIPTLKSLQLSSMRDGCHDWRVAFSRIPLQAQFPSLIHLSILGFPATATYAPDLVTMVPKLRSLELQWDGGPRGTERFGPGVTLSSILNGSHSSPRRPRPQLGKTLKKMRMYLIWPCDRFDFMSLDEERRIEEENVAMWNEGFFWLPQIPAKPEAAGGSFCGTCSQDHPSAARIPRRAPSDGRQFKFLRSR